MRKILFAFGITLLGVINATNAACPEGAERPCVIAGKRGHQVCAGQGWSHCVPDEEPPTPSTGKVHPRYYILMVIYAPPGAAALGGASSSVSYGSGSTAGSTVSATSTFKTGVSVSVTTEGAVGVGGKVGASFDISASNSNSKAVDITKSTSTEITASGPPRDGIEHDYDEIWLWLNPTIELSLTPESATWNLAKDVVADIQYVYVGWLKDPSKIPPGVAQRLQAYGITTQDYQEMLYADPAASLSGGIVAGRFPDRFQQVNQTFPYEPPPEPGATPTTKQYNVSNQDNVTSTKTSEWEYSIGASFEGEIGFTKFFKVTTKLENTWTWTNTSTTAASMGTSQSASLTVGGPSYGYSGPTDITVYIDTLYNTFLFAPVDTTVQPLSLHGSVKSSSGKVLGGKQVVLVANGVKYRTFTNTKGEYRIFGKISGPLQLQVESVKKQLPQLPPDRKADIVLPIAKEESGRQQ